jgi:hypothetical protein
MNFHEEVGKVREMLDGGMPEGPPRVLVNDIEQRVNGLLRAIEALGEEFSHFRNATVVDLDDLRDRLITGR